MPTLQGVLHCAELHSVWDSPALSHLNSPKHLSAVLATSHVHYAQQQQRQHHHHQQQQPQCQSLKSTAVTKEVSPGSFYTLVLIDNLSKSFFIDC